MKYYVNIPNAVTNRIKNNKTFWPRDLAVYCVALSQSNKNNKLICSITELAKASSLARATVKSALEKLQEVGVISFNSSHKGCVINFIKYPEKVDLTRSISSQREEWNCQMVTTTCSNDDHSMLTILAASDHDLVTSYNSNRTIDTSTGVGHEELVDSPSASSLEGSSTSLKQTSGSTPKKKQATKKKTSGSTPNNKLNSYEIKAIIGFFQNVQGHSTDNPSQRRNAALSVIGQINRHPKYIKPLLENLEESINDFAQRQETLRKKEGAFPQSVKTFALDWIRSIDGIKAAHDVDVDNQEEIG